MDKYIYHLFSGDTTLGTTIKNTTRSVIENASIWSTETTNTKATTSTITTTSTAITTISSIANTEATTTASNFFTTQTDLATANTTTSDSNCLTGRPQCSFIIAMFFICMVIFSK